MPVRVREALELLDKERGAKNEMCQAVVNLPPLDAHIVQVRAGLVDTSKQQAIAHRMEALKTEAVYTNIVEKLEKEFTSADVVPGMMALAEALSIAWKDLPQGGAADGDLTKAITQSFEDFAVLLQKVVRHMFIESWNSASLQFITLATDKMGPENKMPEKASVADLERSVGGLKLSQPAVKKCFDVLSGACTTSGFDLPANVHEDVLAINIFGSFIRLAEAIHSVSEFLIDGKLSPGNMRLTLSSTIMNEFYQAIRELEGHRGKLCSAVPVFGAIPASKLWAHSLAAELLEPLRTKFFASIFAHKQFEDQRQINCCVFTVSLPMHIVFVAVCCLSPVSPFCA